MELKIGKIKSIKQAEEKLKELSQHLKDVYAFERLLLEKVSHLKSKQMFEFPNGPKVPYSDIILVKKHYIDKGLGYSDDVERFSEFMFSHPSSQYNVRFLSDDAIKKFGIPHEIRDYYGSPKVFQKDYGEDYQVFAKKFNKLVVITGDYIDPYNFNYTDEQKEISAKRFVNL